MHGYDKLLIPHVKPEKATEILSQLLSSTSPMSQPQIVTQVPATIPLLKPKVFSQSHPIQRPTFTFSKPTNPNYTKSDSSHTCRKKINNYHL